MRVAHAFGRADVDRFAGEIDHEQWAEWEVYFSTEPTGWQATSLMIRRLTWSIFQAQSSKRLRERDYEMRFTAPATGARVASARAEAAAIRSRIEHGGG